MRVSDSQNAVWDSQMIILRVLQDSQKSRRNLQLNWFINRLFLKTRSCKVGTALNLDLTILFFISVVYKFSISFII